MLGFLGDDVPVFDCVGETSIREFIEVVGRARYVVTNDTSAFHIAVAQGCRTFLISGGYTFDRYARYRYADLGYADPVLVHVPMDCYNCYSYCTQPFDHVFPGVQEITVEHAWGDIVKVIREDGSHGRS